MIDPSKPLELSNGTPVELLSIEGGDFLVKIPAGKPYKKNSRGLEQAVTFYYSQAGFLLAFEYDPDYFTLRNKESEA